MGLRKGDGALVGLIGRLADQKNHRLLLDASAELKNTHRVGPLKIGFWGQETQAGYRRMLEARISRLGLSGDVHFFKPEKDMASVYAACDLVVLPSLFEGFPNVVMEGMAAGRIVIATDIVDNAALIKTGVNGFLIRTESVRALADALNTFLRMSPVARRDMGRNAREYVADNFSIEAMVRNTLAVYEEAGV
jgi:glycosyltransferase involved in cell wall biosynthesis